MTEIDDFSRKLKTMNYSQTTIKSYTFSVKRFEKLIKRPIASVDFDSDFDEICKVIDTISSLNTRKLVYISLIKFFKVMEMDVKRIADYAGKHKENRTKIVEVEYKNEVKDSEEGKLVEWTEMKQKFREYMNDESIPKKVNEVFMLGVLLLLEAPTRLGNYKDMRIVRFNPKNPEAIEDIDVTKNTLVVIESDKRVSYQFIFGDYKTAKILGTIAVDVKDPLLKEIVTMMLMDMKPTESILRVTGSYQTQLLRSITNKIYGVPFSVDMIRHSFATWFLKQNYSTQEKIDILKVFGNKYVPNQVDLYMRK